MSERAYSPTAAEALAALDNATFSNTAFEKAARQNVVKAVTSHVRIYEGQITEAATADAEGGHVLADRAQASEEKLRNLIERATNGVDEDSADLVEEWVAADREAAAIVDLAVRLPDRMAGHLERLSDPLTSLSNLQSKYPVNRPAYGA